MVEAVRLEEILRKAEVLSGGPLPEAAGALAELAAQQAMTLCGREDVPEDMEQAVSALLLSLLEGRGETGNGGEDGEAGEAPAAGAVKSIQRGDTTIVYASGSGGAGETRTGSAALAAAVDWSPWRRLGRLRND